MLFRNDVDDLVGKINFRDNQSAQRQQNYNEQMRRYCKSIIDGQVNCNLQKQYLGNVGLFSESVLKFRTSLHQRIFECFPVIYILCIKTLIIMYWPSSR